MTGRPNILAIKPICVYGDLFLITIIGRVHLWRIQMEQLDVPLHGQNEKCDMNIINIQLRTINLSEKERRINKRI